jgi:hypothetical protein
MLPALISSVQTQQRVWHARAPRQAGFPRVTRPLHALSHLGRGAGAGSGSRAEKGPFQAVIRRWSLRSLSRCNDHRIRYRETLYYACNPWLTDPALASTLPAQFREPAGPHRESGRTSDLPRPCLLHSGLSQKRGSSHPGRSQSNLTPAPTWLWSGRWLRDSVPCAISP